MNTVQLEVLRKNYAGINRIDPCGETYSKLIAFLDRQTIPVLETLAGAKIKWVSSLALNRVNRASKVVA